MPGSAIQHGCAPVDGCGRGLGPEARDFCDDGGTVVEAFRGGPDRRTSMNSPGITAATATGPAQLDPIAIIGIGCRLPGGVDDPRSFWELMASGTDAIVNIPAER